MSFELRNRAIVLIFAEVLLIFTSAFWNDDAENGNRMITIFYTAFLCLGGYTMSQSASWLKAYILLTLSSMFFGLEVVDFGPISNILKLACASCAHLLLFKIVLRHSFFTNGVSKSDRILAGVAGYILVGLFWANFFMMMKADGSDRNMAILNQVTGDGATLSEVLYYSFVTITSLGYGDIVPVTPMAKVVATFAGLSGVLYTAIFISALISSLRDKR